MPFCSQEKVLVSQSASRLGRFAAFYSKSLAAMANFGSTSSVSRLELLRNFAMGSWLVFDNLQWMSSFGLVNVEGAKMGRRGNQCWLLYLILSLIWRILRLSSVKCALKAGDIDLKKYRAYPWLTQRKVISVL